MPIIRVRGRSMIPALRPGEILWVSRSAEPLARGQILLLRLKRSPGGFFVKRLIGLPGETIHIRRDGVSVNDRRLVESYVSPAAALEPKPDQDYRLSSEDCLVLGDTRDDSLDSRGFGPVHRDEIVGVVTRRLWPPRRWGRMPETVL